MQPTSSEKDLTDASGNAIPARGAHRSGWRTGWTSVLLALVLAVATAAAPEAGWAQEATPATAQAQNVAASTNSLASAEGEPTRIVVRVASNDAKLLHDGVGGARVRIVDAETGAVLAEGVQTGTSGSTERIMRQPRERGTPVYDTPDAAKFDTTLTLDRPRRVEISATGPLNVPHAAQTTSTTTTLIPGQDVTGDGIVLTLHGFIVEVLQPESVTAGETATVRARVRMMCGCPTEPGGLWDASRYTIRAEAVGADGAVLSRTPLSFTGTTNEYAAEVALPDTTARLRVVASDPERANFGVHEVAVGKTTSNR